MTDSAGAPLPEPKRTGAVRTMLAEACQSRGRRALIEEINNYPYDLFNLSSGLPDTLDPLIWIGRGMAQLETPSGARAEMIFDDRTWPEVLAYLSEMVEAVLEGSVTEETRHCVGGFTRTRMVLHLRNGKRATIWKGFPLPFFDRRREHTEYSAYPPPRLNRGHGMWWRPAGSRDRGYA